MIAHTGSLPGYISVTVLLPGRRSGLMVMLNAEEDGLRRTVRYGGTDLLQGFAGYDWLASSRKVQAEEEADALKRAAAATTPSSASRRRWRPTPMRASIATPGTAR